MQSFEEYRDQFIKASMEGQNSIAQAKRDAEAQDLIIFVPNINAYSEEELDELYDKYMGMTKPFRRKADWITLQYFGMSNQTLYEIMKSIKLLDNKRPDVSMNNASGSSDDPIFLEMYMDDMPDTTDHPNIRYVSAADDINVGNVLNDFSPTPAQMEDAEAWEKETDFILMPLHTETLGILEKYWDLFNLMTHKHRRVSDWKCQEIFGTTNMQFYLWIKSTFNKEHDNRSFRHNRELPFHLVTSRVY